MNASADPVAILPSIEAEVNCWLPKPGRPRADTSDPPPGAARSAVGSDPRGVVLRDFRLQAGRLTRDGHGFGLVRHESAATDWDDEGAIHAVYYPEAERPLREITGTARVFVFDHILRRSIAGAADSRDGPHRQLARVRVDHMARFRSAAGARPASGRSGGAARLRESIELAQLRVPPGVSGA